MHVIIQTVHANDAFVAVVEHVARARVEVARLAHAPDIDDGAVAHRDLELRAKEVVDGHGVQEHDGHVRVPDETNVGPDMIEGKPNVVDGLQIVEVFGKRRAAVDRRNTASHVHQLQAGKVFHLVGGEPGAGPVYRIPGVGVEIGRAELLHRGPVVVPCNDDGIQVPHGIHALAGVGPVADQVAQTDQPVGSGTFNFIQNGVQGF